MEVKLKSEEVVEAIKRYVAVEHEMKMLAVTIEPIDSIFRSDCVLTYEAKAIGSKIRQ